MGGQFDSVVGYKLVDVAVLVSFRLRVADQYYHLWLVSYMYDTLLRAAQHTRGFPMVSCVYLEEGQMCIVFYV